MTTASLPRVPEGLRDLMKVYTKEVLREKPADLYGFSANFFNVIVGEKSHQVVRKYEPVQTYETIMKNRVRQQVPLSLVFNIIPEKLTDLIKQFIKAVLREKPENIYIFAQEYFQRMSKEKSGRIEYTKYSTYEKSLKDKENVTPVSKVTCECGRILSAKTKDVENTASAYTDTKLAEADQSTFSSNISYLQSVVIIQRHFRRYLKQRNLGREKDKCNSVEYVAAILLIQRQVRRLLAKKRVEEHKNSRDARKLSSKFNAADYMKAVVVIQRHYRVYLKRKQEQNRLKNGTVSLATAAIIIQRAFRRMVALHRAKRSASSAADQAEELNDNASETGSYTSVSTALLSTESTELGIANFEERVHQKIIHEDEEVDNDNVDVGLEKEFAEPIKGAEKSIQLKKSEILSGALIENMICKPNLENVKGFNNKSKDLEVDAKAPAELENIKDFISESKDLEEDAEIPADSDIEADKSIASQDQEPEIISITGSIDLLSAAQIELKAKHDEEEQVLAKEAQLKTIKASLDIESETLDELEDKTSNLESKYVAETKPKNESVDIVEQEGGEFKDPNLAKEIEKKENYAMDHVLKTVEDSSDELGDEQEKSVKAEVTPSVSIEIEHVIDVVEDSISTHHDANVDLVRDLSGTELMADELNSEPNEEEVSTVPLTPIKNEESIMLAENDSLIEHENKPFQKSREKRSTEDKEIVQSNSESHESSIKGDFDLLNESDEILKPILQDEVQITNDKALGESSETILATEDIPRTENETISGSTETFTNNAREPLEEVVKPTIEEFTSVKDSQIDDAINDCKEIISKSIDTNDNSQIENELLKSDIKNIEEPSDLSKAELENKLLDDLKAKKGEVEILVEPETYKMGQNIGKSLEKSDHLLENIKADNSSDETDILQSEIKKLSNQETLLIGSESLGTENISPVEGDIFITSNSEEPKAEFHNFGVFIEGTAEKDKNNGTDTPKLSECTNEAAITDISESMGEIIVPASTVIVDDSLTTSLEHEFKKSVKNGSEGSDTQTENIEDNKETKMSNASESGHSTKISIDDSIIDNTKFSTEVSEIAGAEDETLPIESETMLVNDNKLVVGSTEVDNISNEGSKSLQHEVSVSDTKTLPINFGSEKVGDSELEHKSTELDSCYPELTEVTKHKSNTFNDEMSETTEKALSTSEEKKHSSELVDSHKSSKEYIENSTQPNEREMSIINTVIAVMELSDKNETVSQELKDKAIAVLDDEDTLAVKNKESDSMNEPTLDIIKDIDSEEILDKTKSALEKKKPDEGLTAALLEDESPDPETKPKKDDSTDLGSSSAAVEDKCTGESKPKTDSPAASTSEKISSLLVSNQLIGTQNLPTNHIEIEKNTKKLSSPSVKDKDIGTLTSGRLVPTPIAELQLKSFKTPNDDGAWYDIYMEPKITSEKDSDNTPSPVQIVKPDTSSVGEEPAIVAERSPSYYTPKEIVEAVVPKAKNSVSFFISFDSDVGKPKYKIPKKFRDQPKKDTMKEIIKNDDIQSESEVDSNDEEIEVIEVSEGDPEYQQTGGSKLQTILELDNENEQPTEISNENSALEPELEDTSIRIINKVESKMEKVNSENISVLGNEKPSRQSTKSDIERYELAYNTDISRMTRSVQIIEKAYKRFTNKRSLNSEPDHESDFSKQNRAAIIIQKWVRESLRKRSLQVSSDISQKSKESLAAKKIQRAFRRYVEKTTERKSASKHFTKNEETAALVIQKAIRLYLQRNNVELNKTQFPDKTEFEQNQAAEKIQRAYRRYLKLADKPEKIGESPSQELQEVDNPVVDISTPIQLLKPSDEKEIVVYKSEELQNIEKPLKASLSSIQFLKSTDNPEIMNELQTEELQEVEEAAETISNQILISNSANEPKIIKEEKANELRELENPLKDIENPLKAILSSTQNQKSSDNSVFMKESQTEELQEVEKAAETISTQILMSNLADESKIIKKVKNSELRELDNPSKDTLLSSSSDGPEIITELENSLKAGQLYTPKLGDSPEIINVLKADELEGENLAKVISSPKLADQPKETKSDELIDLKNSLKDSSSPIIKSKAAEETEIINELHSENLQENENLAEANSSQIHTPKLADQPKETLSDDLIELKHSLKDNSSPIPMSKAAEEPEIIGELQSKNLQETENLAEANSSPIHTPKFADQPKETMSDELIELKYSLKDNSSPILMSKATDEPEIISELQFANLQETNNLTEANSSPTVSTQKLQDLQMEEFRELDKHAEANSNQVQDRPEIIMELDRDELQAVNSHAETNSSLIYSSKDEPDGRSSAASIIQKAFRQYMERKKLENFDETSFDSITSSRITAIETSNYQTAGTPLESLVQEPTDEPIEDASKGSLKSEWFVGSTRIIPSQGVVEEHLGVKSDPDPAAITSKTELNTSTQVESVETVDRTHGSLESNLTPGISSSKIDESVGSASEKDNAVSSGLAGFTKSSEAGLGSGEDPLLLSQSDFGGIVHSLDIASTQELVNNFLENEIEYSSKQGPFLPQEVKEEPCVKKSASLVNLSEGESEPDLASQKAENTDSSASENTGLDPLSADTIDKATIKLFKPEEVIEKMSQLRDSKSHDRLPSADPSFDESVVRPMSSLQEQYSLDIEDGDIIVYNRLQRDETRESSAQSDSVVFGEAVAEKIQDKDLLNEEESGRVHLMRHYTIAGDDPRGLFRSVTIDDALSFVEVGGKDMGINSTNSFCLDDETSENIRKKMMAYSLSETDSDYFDPRKTSKEDFDVDTAMADDMGTSTETESTIVSAATKIQAGARGFLTRRRLRRASAGTKSSTLDTKASFGNDAISESLERFIEEEAAKKIQAAYRMHTRKRKAHNRKMEGISLETNLAARRQKLQRGDALRNDSTPDEENSVTASGVQAQKSSKLIKSKTVGEAKLKADMELKWLKMRQNSMPVQIDCEVFRVIPKHMRKRIKSAEANKRK